MTRIRWERRPELFGRRFAACGMRPVSSQAHLEKRAETLAIALRRRLGVGIDARPPDRALTATGSHRARNDDSRFWTTSGTLTCLG